MDNETSVISQAIEQISSLEKQISALLGNNIWNYMQVLDPNLHTDLKIQALTDTAKQLLKEYIDQTNLLLETFGVETLVLDQAGTNLTELFELATFFIYKMRFAKALEQFADYELVRVKTWLEHKILKAENLELHPDNDATYTIYVREAIKRTPRGQVDRQATIKNENNSHQLKTLFSILPYAPKAGASVFQYLISNSDRAAAFRVYPDELHEIITKLVGILLEGPVQTIYSYLQRGYTPRQAQTNTVSYYQKIISEQRYQLAPALADLDKQLTDFARDELNKLKLLEEDSRDILVKEIKEKLVVDFASGELIPQVFYQLEFHAPRDFDETLPGTDHLVDLYMYDEVRLVSDFPLETYVLNLTTEAKENIFEFVTDGNINPNYKLQDYLVFKTTEAA